MIVVMILSIVVDGGLNTAFSIRFYKLSEKENKKNIFTILIYNFVVVLLVSTVFFLYPAITEKLFMKKITSNQKLLVCLLIFATILGRFYTNFLIITKKPRNYFFVNIYFYLTVIAMSFVFLLCLRTGYFAYIYAYLVAHSMLAISGICHFLFTYRTRLNELFSLRRLMSLLKLGLPLVPNSLFLMFLTYADRYILEMYSGLAAVGVYSVGYVFADKIYAMIINPFGQALTPVGFQTFTRSIPEYTALLKKVFEGYCFVMEIFLIVYFAVLREIFEFIVGKQYLEAYNIIGIVIIGTTFFGAASIVGGTIVMKEKTNTVLLFSLISVVFNIFLNFVLIPGFGIYGAALATLVSYVIYFYLFFGYTQKLVYVEYDTKLIVLSGLISTVFLVLIIFISYLDINVLLRLLIKLVCTCIFILMIQRIFNVKNALRNVLQYGYLK